MLATRGETIKITIWLVTRERATWITAAEILGLALLLVIGTGTAIRLVLGALLLVHVGYTALTSLPMGAIPGRPTGVKQYRRNQDLRSSVVGFLNEVRRLEEYRQRAKRAGWSASDIKENVDAAERRIMTAAANVVAVTGRSTSAGPEDDQMKGRGSLTLLTHQQPSSLRTPAI